MAERLGTILWVILLLLSIGCLSAKRFSIMAPNMFHIGVQEKVSIAVFDAGSPVTVKLYLQDYPHRQKTFSQVQGQVDQGSNIFLSVKVEPEDLPYTAPADKQYVYLVAKSDDGHFQFHKEAKILLSYKDGMVFIQTDKPIYTPKQNVQFRVIPLDFDMKPSRRPITVVIENPQGIIVRRWKDEKPKTGIIKLDFQLGDFIIMGKWTITALYGSQNAHNTSVKFEVKEYVLPKFSVKISAPPYILKTNKMFTVNITTRYTYGKAVVGTARVYLGIANGTAKVIRIARHNILLDTSGKTSLTERTQTIRELPGVIWFPEHGRLEVKVEVIERATGIKESAVDKSCLFTSSPYLIKIKDTPKYFKPGLPFTVKVVVTHPNKQLAKNVPMLISAEGNGENLKRFGSDDTKDSTNALGETEFVLDACSNCEAIAIEVKTNDTKLAESENAIANYVMQRFNAENGPLLMVRQLTPGKVGENMRCESYRSGNSDATKLSYAVVSRGRILSHKTTDRTEGIKTWSFRVTPQMSPSARLIGYYIDNNGQVIADSILLKVEDSLPTKVEFPDAYKQDRISGERIQVNEVKKMPTEKYGFKIKAPPGTLLGLLNVDESVYLLRNENRLTKERIFKASEELDLGCGVGGGKDSRDIFKSAGVVLMANDFVTDGREDYGCNADKRRQKRSSGDEFDKKIKQICCNMANNTRSVTCVKRATDSNSGLDDQCKEEFWKCCTKLYGAEDSALLGRSNQGPQESGLEAIKDGNERTFFPETWLFDEKVVGPSGVFEMNATIPDTITTWVMQAFAINNQTGLGLATPLRIVGYKDHFISLKMPYSIKRGEQVSLLATFFNYGKDEMRANMYLKGHKYFCSIAADNKHTLIGTVHVPPNDARSVAVPIIPKRTGKMKITISTLFQLKLAFTGAYINGGVDAVKRNLLVVPEGKLHRKSQSFILDPNGTLNDGFKNGENKPVHPTRTPFQSTRHWQPSEQFQNDSIELKVPRKAIPGTAGAMVYLTGNVLGPVVNTTIEGGLEKFFILPTGCGEQTMLKLAPNVYVLEYLKKIGQLTEANKADALRFIQYGYANQLNYRRDDKSFSAWGNTRPGSTWLTAFVMRVFCKAKQFIEIDESSVCESVDWLIQNQRVDGALPEAHTVSNKRLVGGAYTEGDVAMTAFVLSTLAECTCSGVNSQATILRATAYLEKQYSTLNKSYSMALTAYALSLVNSKEKFKANDRLVQNAVYDNDKMSRYWNAGGPALNVETAGYALLTQIILGRITFAGPIVTYLTNERRGGFGFVSTQDTVVALQALTLYSEKTEGRTLDLKVKLKAGKDGKEWDVHFTRENALERKQFHDKRFLAGKLIVETRGTGVGLLEVEVRYNLPSFRDETCKFDLKAKIVSNTNENAIQNEQPSRKPAETRNNNGRERKNRCKGKKGRKKRKCLKKNKKDKKPPQKFQRVKDILLNVCTRYRGTGSTGMSIINIGILTGFRPSQKSLNELQNKSLSEMDKYEVSETSLVIYLSQIPNDRQLCFNVTFDRDNDVSKVQAASVDVYDYYEPDESCSVFYGPDKESLLNLGVCDIGHPSCKCSQDECTQHDPAINDIVKLTNMACAKYPYVIKGKVLRVEELTGEDSGSMLDYYVQVKRIIQQGDRDLKVGERIMFWKRSGCKSPELKESKEYLFMWQGNGESDELNQKSFVKLWPESNENNNDKRTLNKFAAQYTCPTSSP